MSALGLWLLLGLLAPGDAVYGEPATGFSHGAHPAIPCTDCHGEVARSARAKDPHAPPARVCAGCHPGQAFSDPPRRPTPALQFSHAAHAGRGVECAACHPGGARASKAACQACHDGQQAPSRCGSCHTQAPDGTLQTALGQDRILRPEGHHGFGDHRDPAWARRHGPLAKASPDACAACHRQETCSACHVGRLKPLDLHPADYLVSHPVEARRDLVRCATCHRQQTFCTGCHAQSGVTDRDGPFGFGAVTRGGRRFHPPGFAGADGGPVGPEHHRHTARRSLGTCVSCHQEQDCLSCHSTQATARLRASPHPPGFTHNLCRRALDANPMACQKCHPDRLALEALCR